MARPHHPSVQAQRFHWMMTMMVVVHPIQRRQQLVSGSVFFSKLPIFIVQNHSHSHFLYKNVSKTSTLKKFQEVDGSGNDGNPGLAIYFCKDFC
jgi:hypothetical protein